MGLFDFLVMIAGKLLIVFLLMLIGGRIISVVVRESCAPFIKIIGSLVFALGILFAFLYKVDNTSGIGVFLLSGSIILLNKFWFGHFSKE